MSFCSLASLGEIHPQQDSTRRNPGFRPELLWEFAESQLKGVDLNMSNKTTDNFSASLKAEGTKPSSLASAFTTCYAGGNDIDF